MSSRDSLTLHKSPQTLLHLICGNLLGEKGTDERKVHNPVKQLNSACFINITKNLHSIPTTSSQDMHEMLSS